ncbi:MAG: ROK family protein [Thermodesulfovibrio sp.]|nr:ROK family protein [Thermodesulfovibrio sp.]
MTEKYCIAVDMGGTNTRAALINSYGEVLTKIKEHTGTDPLATLNKLIGNLYSDNAAKVYGIGLAVAGIIDSDNGIVLWSPHIQKLKDVNLKTEIEKSFKTSVVIENDANAAAYGEKWAGTGKDYKNFVVLTLGTGIGGGIIIDNKLLPVAAEVGHMSINSGGAQCACGNIGCLELYASARAIIGNAVSALEKGDNSILKDFYNGNFYKITAEDIYKTALDGDMLARAVLREAGKNLGIGIANIINILSPDAVILTGGLVGAWNIYVEPAIQEASKRAFNELYARVKIIPSSLGDDAGVIGAAALIFKTPKTVK